MELRVHYFRYDQNYEGWDLWLWPKSFDGSAYPLLEVCPLPDHPTFTMRYVDVVIAELPVEELGFLLRKNGWSEREQIPDRYISLASFDSGKKPEIYLVQNSESIHLSPEHITFIPTAERAVFRNYKEIYLQMQAKCRLTSDDTFIVTSNGIKLPVSKIIQLESGTEFVITLEHNWIIGDICMISKLGFMPFCVEYGALFDTPEFEQKFAYKKNDLGCSPHDTHTQFRIWSPLASEIQLQLFSVADSSNPEKTYSMSSDVHGSWYIDIPENLEGYYYTYEVTTGIKTQEVCDPLAVSVSINGKRAYIYKPSRANPPEWDEIVHITPKNPTDAILYEIHVRDFTIHPDSGVQNKGIFLGLSEKGTQTPEGIKTGLDHIEELGVTHVHLMPIFDFYTVDESRMHESKFNWGYDPHLYNVPEGSYSSNPNDGAVRIQELKTAIQALKQKGIGIVMDVVYNHTYRSSDSEFNKLVPGYFYRTDANGRFSNGSGCGNETASGRFMVRKTIVDSILYWAKEYKIDGFRFDLMGLHDIETMNTIRRELDDYHPGLLLYGEGWTGGLSKLEPNKAATKSNATRLMKIGFFNDNTRDAIKGDSFIEEAGGYISRQSQYKEGVKYGIVGAIPHPQVDCMRATGSMTPWAGYPWHCINYAASHDNLTLFDKLVACHAVASDIEAIRRSNLAGAMVLLAQGIPFMLSGTEFLRTKHGVHNSYNSSDQINQLEWNRKSQFLQSFSYYKGLIQLRKEHPAFRMWNPEDIRRNLQFFNTPENTIAYILKNYAGGDSWKTIIVVLYTGETETTLSLPFTANWHVVVNESLAGLEDICVLTGNKLTVPMLSVTVAYSND